MTDHSSEPEVPTAMVVAGPTDMSMADLADLGFILPLATPQRLRTAFAEKQKLYAAILDESDYIYTVSFMENGKTKQNIYTRRADAEKAADVYKVDIRATPKKSGIVKLAAALGIQAHRKTTRGLPEDPAAAYSYVLYEATHPRSGRSEEGIGWCDKGERGGRISTHDVIATADTRAYNRAVLRLAGFGDVSADEIVGSTDEFHHGAPVVVAETTMRKPLALPASTVDEVTMAMRAWAEESFKRDGSPLAEAQQGAKAARELRAKARRGNETAARQMGALGYTWQGVAQDSLAHEPFEVEEPTLSKDDYARIRAAIDVSKAAKTETGPGWNLSGSGNEHEENRKPEEKPIAREQAAANVPAAGVATTRSFTGRDGSVETITTAQAKALSEALLAKYGTKEKARDWLKKHADVERSGLVRQNQLDALKAQLAKEE